MWVSSGCWLLRVAVVGAGELDLLSGFNSEHMVSHPQSDTVIVNTDFDRKGCKGRI